MKPMFNTAQTRNAILCTQHTQLMTTTQQKAQLTLRYHWPLTLQIEKLLDSRWSRPGLHICLWPRVTLTSHQVIGVVFGLWSKPTHFFL